MLTPATLIKYVRNRRKLLSYCSKLIDDFEEELDKKSWHVSCKEDLLKAIKEEIDSMPEDIASLESEGFDLRDISLRMVCTNSFEFFEYGRYHLGGHVNWVTTPAERMASVHRMAIQKALEGGHITKEEQEEDELALQEAIKQKW